MIEYYAVVVLYNKKIQDSITISNLLQLQEEHLHIIAWILMWWKTEGIFLRSR